MPDSISILSTRTLDQVLIEKAAVQGIQIDCHQFIRIVPNLTDKVKKQLDHLTHAAACVVLTSVNAVTLLSEFLGDKPVSWKVFCISGPTCEAVKNKLTGIEIIDTAETGEELAVKIKAHSEIRESVFLGSNIRTPALANGLAGSHVSLAEIFLYKTEEIPVKINNDYTGVLFFSPSAVNSFFSENTVSDKTAFFTIGTTTAKALPDVANDVITSDRPSQESMINKLIEYYNKA